MSIIFTGGVTVSGGVAIKGSVSEATPGNTDPYWNNVVLLVKGEGEPGAMTFPDSSQYNRSSILVGSPRISAEQKMFGATSIKTNNAGSVSYADSPDFDFGSGDFTVEMWMRPQLLATFALFSKRISGYSPLLLQTHTDNRLYLSWSTTGTSWSSINGPANYAPETWAHIAVTREGSTIRVFCNGVLANSGAVTGALMTNTSPFTIGAGDSGPNFPNSFQGYIDEVRVTKGVARYTADFTVPTEEFPTA